MPHIFLESVLLKILLEIFMTTPTEEVQKLEQWCVEIPLNYASWNDIPDDILDTIWKDIQVATVVNKHNRSMHGPPHRYGRKAFAIIREEMQELGEETDLLSVYMRTRTDANVVPISEETARIIV
ncbi:hypothetical protein M9H77_35853 [Catharanthus roseus]|uniref:Uncharacterized protein n=1 Tax=Catharanthus roseus TaxID=4058 RepID=A0ACB9ZQI7_CATRO|nr:hypothetical protein M9H77_35853 [Catharanthus roseus]